MAGTAMPHQVCGFQWHSSVCYLGRKRWPNLVRDGDSTGYSHQRQSYQRRDLNSGSIGKEELQFKVSHALCFPVQ